MFGKNTAGGSLFNNASTPTSTPTPANNTLQKPFKVAGQGLFGNANSTAGVSTPSPSINPLNSNNGTSAQGTGNGLFGSVQPNSGSGGLFGTNNTQKKGPGFTFGQSTTSDGSGGLFGRSNSADRTASATSTFGSKPNGVTGFSGPSQASGGLFSNPNASNSTQLFGNQQSLNNNAQGALSFNNVTSNTSQPQSSSNPYGLNVGNLSIPVSTMPASITAPVRDNKPALDGSRGSTASITSNSTAPSRRTYSVSSTISNSMGPQVSLPASSKSSLINKLSARLKTAPNFSSTQGIFTPSLDGQWSSTEQVNFGGNGIPDSRDSTSNQKDSLPSNGFKSLSLQRGGVSDMRKLKIDPSRSVAKKMKLFTGKATPTKSHANVQDDDEKFDDAELKVHDDERQDLVRKTLTKESDELNCIPSHDRPLDNTKSPTDNSGYWCSPSPDQLAQLTEEQATAVPDFMIGRKGYGSITFQHDVDLSAYAKCIEGELFGKTVVFNSNKTVEVYPDDSKKPPIGCGLNVPAIITLDNVYPIDKKSKKELKDEANSNEVQVLVRKLRNIRSMEFISYNPFGGVWTFKVNHFSIWGLTNEEDAEVDEQEVKDTKANSTIQKNYKYPGTTRSLAQSKSGQDFLPGTFESQGDELPRNEMRNDIMTIHQASISHSPPLSPPESDILVEEKPYEPDINESDFEGMANEPAFSTSNNWVEQLHLAGSNLKSVFAEPTDFSADNENDIELLFNEFNENLKREKEAKEKMRIKNFNFAKFTSDSSLLIQAPNRKSGVRNHIIPTNSIRDPAFVDALFSKHINLCTFTGRGSNNYPQVTGSQLQFSDVAELCNPSSVEHTLWSLCSVLFDAINLKFDVQDPAVEDILLKKERHKKICSWIVEQTRDEIDARIKDETDALELVFLYLLKNDIANACKIAIKSQNGHLAILMSNLGSNDPRIRDLAAGQLEKWHSCGQKVSPPIARIFRLLAGDEVNEEFLNQERRGCIGWLPLLGANLYYGKVDELSLEEVVASATRSFNSNKHDFTLTIFKLYGSQKPMESVFEELKDAVSPLDYSMPWYISQILRFGKDSMISDFMNDKLTSDFIGQLRLCQLHKEALFAASFFSDDSAAKQQIDSIVYHEISALGGASNEDILQRLHIPMHLIERATALKHRYDGDYLKEAQSLIKAQDFEEAEKVVVEVVGPMLIINGTTGKDSELSVLQDLLSRFTASDMKNWSTGLGVYDNYVKLRSGSSTDKQLLDRLLDGVCLLFEAHKKCREIPVCCSIISQFVAAQFEEQNDWKNDESFRERLLKLPLGQPERKYLESSLA